jgi:hypothetical protein
MRQYHRSSHPLRRLVLTAVGALWFAGACATAPAPPQQDQLAQAVSPPERATPPVALPPLARDLLRSRMANHTHDMGELVSAIMLLDYILIEERARAIAADVSLSRPITGDATELNTALPESFFQRQDGLRTQARELERDAQAQDARRVAADYGRLAEACVRCHADFRPTR